MIYYVFMVKKIYSKYGALASLIIYASCFQNCRYRKEHHSSLVDENLSNEQKEERHRFYSGDQTKHKFTINGVVITACNKKTAIKIYKRLMASQKS